MIFSEEIPEYLGLDCSSNLCAGKGLVQGRWKNGTTVIPSGCPHRFIHMLARTLDKEGYVI